MAKKAPNKTTRGRTKAQKATNSRKTTKEARRDKKFEPEKVTSVPANIGSEHNTFKTLKRKAAMLEALKYSMGMVTPAADMVGIHPSTHYRWMESDPGYADEVHWIEESKFDFVESKMIERIHAGSETMLIWYSKTKMKRRGFVEQTQVEVTHQQAFVVNEDQAGIRKTMDVIHKKTGTSDK